MGCRCSVCQRASWSGVLLLFRLQSTNSTIAAMMARPATALATPIPACAPELRLPLPVGLADAGDELVVPVCAAVPELVALVDADGTADH